MHINNIYILFLMIFLISLSAAQGDNIQGSKSNDKIQYLVDLITRSDKPSNVVLSIDCSGSIENEDAKNASLDFLSRLNKFSTKGNIHVGYVAWSEEVLNNSSTLSSNISDVHQEIKNSSLKHDGVTCMRLGLNDSIKLLRGNEEPGKYNILILISDGLDNCTPDSNLTCDNIRQLNTSGIDIYSIQIGKYPKGGVLLGCLENNFAKYNPPSNNGETNDWHVVDISSNDMTFQANGNNGGYRNPYTNMTASKVVTWGDYGPRITLTVRAPSVKNISTNIAIAVDSSGSLGVGGRVEYGDSVRKSMPDALNLIKENNKYSNVSIISWDDNIDFEYGPLPISDVINLTSKNNVFMNEIEYPFPLNYLQKYILRIQYDKNNAYYCNENETTNLSVGLDRAITVLNNTKKSVDGVRKIIILITARSEFTPCNQTIIDLAKRQNCSIVCV